MLDYILIIKQSQGCDIPNSSGSSSSAYVVTLACNVRNSKSYYLKCVEVTQTSHLLSLLHATKLDPNPGRTTSAICLTKGAYSEDTIGLLL